MKVKKPEYQPRVYLSLMDLMLCFEITYEDSWGFKSKVIRCFCKQLVLDQSLLRFNYQIEPIIKLRNKKQMLKRAQDTCS